MARQIIELDVRADSTQKLEHVAALVGQALNCTFAEGEHQRWYAQVAFVFGLKLSLVGRSGIGGKQVAKLMSNIGEPRLIHAPDGSRIELDEVDISAYIADLLTVRTGLQWYLPTAEDRLERPAGLSGRAAKGPGPATGVQGSTGDLGPSRKILRRSSEKAAMTDEDLALRYEALRQAAAAVLEAAAADPTPAYVAHQRNWTRWHRCWTAAVLRAR
ncbi:hypothetical protein [Actinospica robiniae]|uniref:hypothetical protein n=1 Tax=Actinospica robiniae TaxID=304901 RepID=UPI000553CA1C|nr:hypothetical protein [Actinospica robiniae]